MRKFTTHCLLQGTPLLVAIACFAGQASADVVSLNPSKDNTIYEDSPGTNSNGSGVFLFSGTQASVGDARRALIQFDLSNIPAGSVINSASLQLRVSQTISGTQNMGAHLVTSDWGEGSSDAPGQEGGGTPAATGDATWLSAFHPGTAWVTNGGDFEATASAITGVSGSGSSPVWSSSGMAADVQDWVNGVKPNFGWIIVHQNEVPLGTAKRFGSREGTASSRPVLTVDFTPGSLVGVSYCFGDGSGTSCPCGNQGATGEGCANGSGSGAILSGGGSASVSAADLVLSAENLIPSQPGLYFQGNNAVNSANGNPFGDGLRCAGGGVIRLQVRFADSSGTSQTSANIAASGGVNAGDTKRYQIWYRDPASSPCNTQFNLSNGYEITWSA